jgi:hypothetical protein
MSKKRKPNRKPGRITSHVPGCPDPMHRLVMLAGTKRVKAACNHGWPIPIAVFDALLDLPDAMHPQAVRILGEMQPGARTAEQMEFSLDNASGVLLAIFASLCSEYACSSCKAHRHCDRSDPVACWCPECDPELDDDYRAWAAR